ncbi:hypothetical protein N7468_005404 [Penicillium chermesinum]|uniref:cAMP-mediated signaling protein Sok1 n=1 Tax=Penicillium chermesinum TaxID=63820 RepID=A0A9W9TNC9_9EURO|nr:uncharacterized protein N7468_005404 [Penicillium chermesinum]KAJ5232448.1 hypothetical protein N7468_005404 [Penicillium chermesinum]
MDLQGTKEARTQEEGADGPLDRSKEYHKNEGRDSHNHDNTSTVHPLRRQPQFTYPPGPHSPSTTRRAPSPSPEAVIIPQALGLSSRDVRLLCRARRHPPVTKRTLSELDLPCIMSNINLRMDANFDRDLHFKPDLDGEKGKRKRKEAADYWDSMATEIAVYAFCAAYPDAEADSLTAANSSNHSPRTFEPRLPAMFETLQEIIKTLVPERDHPSVMENLEVALLMQQIRKGVLDMVALAKWMAALLKTHCAPMRDDWADRMVEQITQGSQSQEPKEVVNGLQTLFAILEAMKLDVANHQIRTFRVLLIEDTVPFLHEYFEGKIKRGSFQVEPSRLWYIAARSRLEEEDAAKDRSSAQPDDSLKPLEAMFRGILELLLQFNAPNDFPDTFLFDSDRLWQLRSTVQNLINLEIAWYIFESQRANDREDPDLRGGTRWMQNMRSIALEIARFACAACCLDSIVADEVISPIEAALEWHLSNDSDLFRYFQNIMREKILTATLAFTRQYLPLSPLAICESQRVPPQVASTSLTPPLYLLLIFLGDLDLVISAGPHSTAI